MTRWSVLVGAIAMTGCSACATARPPEPKAPVSLYPPIPSEGGWPGSEASLALIGLDGDGSGCPVGPYSILTAAHVARLAPLAWKSQNEGGETQIISVDAERDLALLSTDSPLPAWLPIADQPPVAGEPVAIFGEIAGVRTVFVARVLAIDPLGRLLLDGMAFPGSSGGCVASTKGKVYGIVQGGVNWPSHPQVRAVAYAGPVWERKKP